MPAQMMRIAAWLSDLRVAIVLLLLIALSSAIGTAIPQGDAPRSYIEAYATRPWLGLLHGEQVLQLQLDHVYSSLWFLTLLAWLGLALILCSWRRQWPALQAARRWIDYSTPRQSQPSDERKEPNAGIHMIKPVSYTHLTLPTKRIV